MGKILTRLAELREWKITTAPAASATEARLQFGSTALSSGHASGTYLGGNNTGSADLIHFQSSGSTVFRVGSGGVVSVGGSAPTSAELAYFKHSSATVTKLVHLENDTNFTASDTPVRFQVKAVLSSVAKLAYFGLDRYFDSSGSMLISTDAAAGIVFSSNNNNVRGRLTPGGNLTCAGGLGCGNSASASSLGALSKVSAVYALDGSTLLGYMPLYASYS